MYTHRYLGVQLTKLIQAQRTLDLLVSGYQQMDAETVLLNLTDVIDGLDEVHSNLSDIGLVLAEQLTEDENTPIEGEPQLPGGSINATSEGGPSRTECNT